MGNQVSFFVNGQVCDQNFVDVANAQVQAYMAIMEPSGTPSILTGGATTDIEGDFQVQFTLPFGSDVYSIWVPVFASATQTKGSAYGTDYGHEWTDGQTVSMGTIQLK